MVSRFFENVRSHSEIKLRILDQFLAPWAAKLGYWSRRSNRLIWYVDGFAGQGRYDDGSEGSPLLGLRRALEIRSANREYQLACSFVDNRRKHWQSLEKICDPFRANGIIVNNHFGKFADLIPEIREYTSGSPMLLFVDPFGISTIKYQQLKMLLNRQEPVDIILNFAHRAVYRLATDYPHLITDAIGSDEWRERWGHSQDPQSRMDAVLTEFRANLLNDGRFTDVFFYPIRDSIHAYPRYYLVFGSRHYDAFELWNDSISREENRLTIRSYLAPSGQTSFLAEVDEDSQVRELFSQILSFCRLEVEFTREDIVKWFVEHQLGEYHTSDVRSAVRNLLASGQLSRQNLPGKGVATDRMTVTE